ncbi:hypothetical protein SEA_PHINKY_78 [Microbacterium phage Phinky]|nr:hypothetical protein SEA_PHINKY_78 [Microbacterium phage Phinky]
MSAYFHPALGMVDEEAKPEPKPAFHPVHGHGGSDE